MIVNSTTSRSNHVKTGAAAAVPAGNIRRKLNRIYHALFKAYGPRNWWPGESPTEIVIGAILTQNTNWKNVEKAIARLRAAGLIDWQALRQVAVPKLAEIIRPAGYHNLKARRLNNFVDWLFERFEGRLERLREIPIDDLRAQLLQVNGIGPETADAILLYAVGLPTFVVDAYTGRVARRHGLIEHGHDYAALKSVFEENLPRDLKLYNEFHALLVEVGKRHCGPDASCTGCPLARFSGARIKGPAGSPRSSRARKARIAAGTTR
ncbi:MAG TPA: endonuclease III domain-containing protein [Phycisphaerae bacterium]|nr:endonuclease III domain-containing protein [Phycisphaerae bacterium]